MANGISSYAIQLQTVRLLRQGTGNMADLQEQLATGKKTQDLSQLGATDTRRLLNLRDTSSRYESYQLVINTVSPRVNTQGTILDNMQDIIEQIQQSINTTGSYETAVSAGLGQQVDTALIQIQSYLNENIDGRYLFAGGRYGTEPVVDLSTLPVPPVETYPFTPAVDPDLPSYDTEYAATPVAEAWRTDTANISDGISVNYGITSTDPAFQNMIMGLRWAKAALADQTNYDTYIGQASALLDQAHTEIRGLQTKVVSNQSLLKDTKADHQAYISQLKGNEDDIIAADKNEVAAKITIYQSQVEASYAATSRLIQLSIVNYL